jgi:peptidoglycan/LPS O-acetylase OafA/YrhL
MVIDTPSGFVPSPGIVLFYWVFFMVGAPLARQPSLIPLFWARWRGALAVGMLIVLPLTGLLGAFSFLSGTGSDALMRNLQLPSVVENLMRPLVDGGTLSAAVARVAPLLVEYGYAMYGWMLVFGIMGAFQHFFTRPSKIVRFIAESSYWVYLVHFPLVLMLQVLVQDVQVPAIIKYCLLCTIVLALLMGSYQLFVRNTFVGVALGGRPLQRRKDKPATV